MRTALIVGWVAFASIELWLGRGLRHPPTLSGGAAALAAALLVGLVHARLAAREPRTALALPELPGLLATLLWAVAAGTASSEVAEGGGAPLGGSATGRMLAAMALPTAFLIARRVALRSEPRAAAPRAAATGALAAFVGLVVSAWVDPTWFPSVRTLPLLGGAFVAGLAATAGIAAGAAVRPTVGVVVAAAVGLCATVHVPSPRGADGERIVLVTVDTLRSDTASRMASVQRLAARGETFTDALTSGAWTVPAMGSALTGRWPAGHGAGRPGTAWPGVVGLDASVPTLAERLQAAGWHTGAATTNVFLVPVLGFDRGFDAYLHADARPDAPLLLPWLLGRTAGLAPRRAHRDAGEEVVDTALAWLDGAGSERAFLWVHLLDPHLPYHHAVLASDDPLFHSLGRLPATSLTATSVRRGNIRGGLAERDAIRRLYEAEVGWADRALGRLLDGLEAHGRTTVLLTADHGEELWEHGGFEHGHALWPEITHIPFVLARPGGPTGTTRSEPVSIVDVTPTVLAVAGVPSGETDGVDVRGAIDPQRVRRLQGTLYFAQQEAVVVGDEALVAAADAPPRLYDRAADPGFTTDLASARPDSVVRLAALLQGTSAGGAAATVDTEALRALGYVD